MFGFGFKKRQLDTNEKLIALLSIHDNISDDLRDKIAMLNLRISELETEGLSHVVRFENEIANLKQRNNFLENQGSGYISRIEKRLGAMEVAHAEQCETVDIHEDMIRQLRGEEAIPEEEVEVPANV